MSDTGRDQESRRLEAAACREVKENKIFIGFKPAIKSLLLDIAHYNNWQLLKTELEKK